MRGREKEILVRRLSEKHLQRILSINNSALHCFVAEHIELCSPEEVFICADEEEDWRFIRTSSLTRGEEQPLSIQGHTVHFDGYDDQGRDKENTRVLLPGGTSIGQQINTLDREEGLREIRSLLEGAMEGRYLYVLFFCLGPAQSKFAIPCVQLTDSAYVAHSEHLLYRPGYEEFKRREERCRFFKFVHSQGALVGGVSACVHKRRVYIDIPGETVFSVNTQYGGNSMGLKKLAMRLAIKRASEEGWLTEHMFIMGVHGPGGRVTYFAGAFPSLCGKTSTSMIEGETIVGDDIAYLRAEGGKIRAVNAEKGMFGIIQGINSKDDPILWNALHQPGEIIFSNVLVTPDGHCYWTGKDDQIPWEGTNHSGRWYRGKKDRQGKEIPPSHPNARFTLELKLLENLDPEVDNPEGVIVGGIIYGCRDSDTWVPVEQAFSWDHGIVMKGAALESETTAATLGVEGVRDWNPMSNLDFLSIPVGRYIENNLKFGQELTPSPPVFSVNYFLKDARENFLNEREDKVVWLKWMELRSHQEIGAITAPTGFIPRYEDLQRLFREVLRKNYTKEAYDAQFTIRIPENLAKLERVAGNFKKVADMPARANLLLAEQRARLLSARERWGDYISPERLIR